jgi:hypothetical protein
MIGIRLDAAKFKTKRASNLISLEIVGIKMIIDLGWGNGFLSRNCETQL